MYHHVKRLVGIGGCHIIAYPFPIQDSFINILAGQLGISEEKIAHHPYVGVNRLRKVLDSVDTFDPDDLIIFQIGHFESIKDYNPKSLSFRRIRPGAASSGSTAARSISDETNAKSRAAWLPKFLRAPIKLLIRSTLFTLRELAGKPAFSEQEFGQQLKRAFDKFDFPVPQSVVLLGAFPCQDWTTNVHRTRMNVEIKKICETYGFTYAESYEALTAAKRKGVKILHDELHISEAAHRVVAQDLFLTLDAKA